MPPGSIPTSGGWDFSAPCDICQSIIGKNWTYQPLPINILAWWFLLLSQYSSMFYTETYLLYFFTFRWIRAMWLHQVEKIWYLSLIFMKFGQHIRNIYGQFLCWNGILTKTAPCQNFYSKFDWIQNMQLKIGVPCHKNGCSPTILMQTKPFIVSTNLSIVSLFHETFLRPLHDMPITGYPKVW